MKKVVLFLLGFILLGSVVAQSGKPVRLEFPADKYSTDIRSLLCDTLGLCVTYPSYINDSLYCNILQYDVHLAKTNESRIPVNAQMEIAASAFDKDCVYILFQKYLKKKKETTGLLLKYHLESAITEWREISGLPASDLSRFTALDGNIFFISYLSNNKSNLYFLPKGDKYVRQLFLANAPDYTVNDYLVDEKTDRVMICVNTSSNSKNNVLWLCETDLYGNTQRVIDFPDTGVYRFQNARIAKIKDDRFLLLGTYQIRKTAGNMADGIYASLYESHKFQEPILYALNQSVGGKQDDVLYLVSNIFTGDSLFAFVAESFYPEYRYSTTYHYGVPSTDMIFMGYRFIDAQMHVFDTKGYSVWDYTFPFDNMMVTNLTTHLRTTFLSDYIVHYFTMGSSLTTMMTDRNFNLEDPIRTLNLFNTGNSEEPTNYTLSLSKWYDNYFILSGFRFKQGSTKGKRPVFFLHKMKYQ